MSFSSGCLPSPSLAAVQDTCSTYPGVNRSFSESLPAFVTFIGFEGRAKYRPLARDPRRLLPIRGERHDLLHRSWVVNISVSLPAAGRTVRLATSCRLLREVVGVFTPCCSLYSGV